MAETELLVGHARVDITPPVGTHMMGYGSRKEPAAGIHDPLYANAVALSDGTFSLVILALDICWLDLPEVDLLKQAISKETGLAADQVLFNASHTHAGPQVARFAGETFDVGYFDTMVGKSVDAVAKALADLAPASLGIGAAPVDIGCNRRERTDDGRIILGLNPEGQTLGEATVWRFARADRDDVIVFSIPIHGTTLGGENLYISAEWMGVAVNEIERQMPGLQAVFLQGCGADQNPYRGVRTFEQMTENGTKAAAGVLMALKDTAKVEALPLMRVLRDMPLPVEGGGVAPCPIHGVRIGDVVMVGLCGEAFVEYALFGRKRSAARSTAILGYTNGSVGYLPTAIAYEEGGYEPTSYKHFAIGRSWRPSVERVVKGQIEQTLNDLDSAQPIENKA